MGKGKGMLERSVMRFKKNFKIFEFIGFSHYKLKKFILNVNKKFNCKFYLYTNKNTKYNFWCKNNKYVYFFDKYLIF